MQIYEIDKEDFLPIDIEIENTFSIGLLTGKEFMDAEWLCMEISISGGDDTNIWLEWAENSDSESQFYMQHTIIPNCFATIAFQISEKNFSLHSAFIPPFGALRKGNTNGKPMKKAKAGFIKLKITSETLTRVIINRIFFSNTRPEGMINGQPVIDVFGQRIKGDWKNKTKNEKELIEYLESELASAENAKYPDGWSAFGGWTGLQREATGFFRTEKIDGRWWLIDPEGYAFFSNGVSYSARAGVFGFTEEYRSLHEYLPEKDSEFADAWSTASNIPQYIVRNGADGAEKMEMFSFGRSNLIRAFGKEWYSAYTKITTARMRRMGFNTVCVGTNDYFDEQTDYFLKESQIPYVVTFRDFPLTKERIFRDFPDVFSNEYEELCQDFAERSLRKYANDPYLIGYFVTNEPEWLFSGDVNLAEQMLKTDGCVASKVKFTEFLSSRYEDINSLNAAWGTKFKEFIEVLEFAYNCTEFSHFAYEDICLFEGKLIKQYAEVVSKALYAVDPNHLNLGMRYSWFSQRTTSMDLKNFDVFSINCYRTSPRDFSEQVSKHHDIPVLIGEWHFGAKECGLPAFGLHYTETQEQRAAVCKYYCESATQDPNIVGIHYFEYNDQPYFGRFDGECYQIGLFDVCHRPYDEVCNAFENFAWRLYPLLLREETMTAEPQSILK